MVTNMSVVSAEWLRMRKIPVKDISIDSNTNLSDLISQFSDAGGFVATKIATAANSNWPPIEQKIEKQPEKTLAVVNKLGRINTPFFKVFLFLLLFRLIITNHYKE